MLHHVASTETNLQMNTLIVQRVVIERFTLTLQFPSWAKRGSMCPLPSPKAFHWSGTTGSDRVIIKQKFQNQPERIAEQLKFPEVASQNSTEYLHLEVDPPLHRLRQARGMKKAYLWIEIFGAENPWIIVETNKGFRDLYVLVIYHDDFWWFMGLKHHFNKKAGDQGLTSSQSLKEVYFIACQGSLARVVPFRQKTFM